MKYQTPSGGFPGSQPSRFALGEAGGGEGGAGSSLFFPLLAPKIN